MQFILFQYIPRRESVIEHHSKVRENAQFLIHPTVGEMLSNSTNVSSCCVFQYIPSVGEMLQKTFLTLKSVLHFNTSPRMGNIMLKAER